MTAILFTLFGTTSVIEFDATLTETHTSSARATEHPVEEGASVTDHVRPELDRVALEGFITNTPINDVSADLFGARRVAAMKGDHKTPLTLYSPSSRQSKVASMKGLPDPAKARAFSAIASRPGGEIVTYRPPLLNSQPKLEVIPGERRLVPHNVQGTSLQFASPIDRVKEVYNVLQMLCTTGVEVTLVTDLREYPTMLIEKLSAPRQAMAAMSFSLELKQVRFAQVKTGKVAVKRVAEKRAETKADEGAKPTYVLPEEEAAQRESVLVQTSGSSRVIEEE
jgi:hypothetical protein